MEGVDQTAKAAADTARVRKEQEPMTKAASTREISANEARAAKRAAKLAADTARQGGIPAAEPTPERKRGVAAVFAGLLLAMFVSTLSETVTATALPTIVGDLGGVDHMQWVTTAYILASTIMMPIYGKLGDLFGRKYLFIVALSIFHRGLGYLRTRAEHGRPHRGSRR